MAIDVESIRKAFPFFETPADGSRPPVYLDSAATTQKPAPVLDALAHYYTRTNANVHRGVYRLAVEATELYEGARRTVAAFVGAARPEEIVFTKNATEAVNLLSNSLMWAGDDLRVGPGDEIVVTEMEHHSNLIPWRLLAERAGATVRYLGITDDGRLDLSRLSEVVTERTRVVAVVHASNILGTVNPIAPIAARAAEVGALLVVDAAQSVPHLPVDVAALGADFVTFSGHKMCGPTGIGVLWGRHELLEALPPFLGGGEMIETVSVDAMRYAAPPLKFEAGTPPVAQAVGLGAACDFLAGIGMDAIAAHDQALVEYALERLGRVPGIRFIGPADGVDRLPLLSFVVDGVPLQKLRTVLDEAGIAVRSGHHCAQLACSRFGIPAAIRSSFYLYNAADEVDHLAATLEGATRSARGGGAAPAFEAGGTARVRPYREVLVPAIFGPWAERLVGALAPAPGARALDVGTGPGTVARVLAAAVGPAGAVVGTDPSLAMLALAREEPPPSGARIQPAPILSGPIDSAPIDSTPIDSTPIDSAPIESVPIQSASIQYVECGAAPLHVSDEAFDVVTAQQVLQFVPDRRAAVAEMRRAARPGARIAIVTWLPLERNPLFRALRDAVGAVLGPEEAELFAEPWTLAGEEVAALVEEAGFTGVEVREWTVPVTLPGGPDALCCLFGFSAVASPYAAGHGEALRQAVRELLARNTDERGLHGETAASVVTARA
ncbi:SufS family cysteine desulfurase [Nonomuraea roseoviolacea]|uniref:cysteine desulfurase n=1 Tax=Nonomuraea roseoviolacea subsp. carminata TaxID=160689 RepID=A0ABT1JSL6_9ACTN|nr:SufS family cysteine desulfurase [Nonomuraea roseoviolacea]MCP2344720.1 SufS family cysteine desulfurase [Nonomuraea roseoviolacea subsp. carminata]